MLDLIVNADDFGINDKVNEEILRSFRYGILRSASIMANGNSFIEAVNIAKDYKLDIGIHIALVNGKSLNDPFRISSLIDKQDKFYDNSKKFLVKYFLGKILLEDVKKEVSLQIERVMDYRLKITHIDSHQHLHLLPNILEIIKDFAKKYSIKFIRFPREKFTSYFLKSCNYQRLGELAAINLACSYIKGKIPHTTDHFVGFFYGGQLNKHNLSELIKSLPAKGTCELMCHPGLSEADRFSRNNYRKCEESKSLIDDEIIKMIKVRHINITSYKDLL